MGMHQYLKSLSNLETIYRAPGFFKYQKHSVAEHSFKVAEIAQFLGDVEENAGNEVNWRSLYEKSLNHDYNERFIGDIKTPVKYATSDLRSMLASVEDSMKDNFVKNEIPVEFQAAYERRLSEGKDETLEGKILSVSDKVDLLYESFGEIQKGNPESVYTEIYKESLRTIVEFKEMPSVEYFLDNVLPELLNEEFTDQLKLERISREIIR
ncbi:YfbR-like 5'-deoxynucleotidase [Pediococcus stilesii]|uniref:HD domain-containing protein n=1 Tax=Pediococcus stilesii TaxID=331679 RepID=A0A0R2L659_9LACO|nr:YfbR-like 5'-deoxynucleotidase [Pediococcus stilesii]KRN94413.1 HD superfamily hydrolase [Pediococcus stilesii]TLQ03425.1 HD domain-containing protein [Pediococcus stilesii]